MAGAWRVSGGGGGGVNSLEHLWHSGKWSLRESARMITSLSEKATPEKRSSKTTFFLAEMMVPN